jgi:predicted phosphodiesterase
LVHGPGKAFGSTSDRLEWQEAGMRLFALSDLHLGNEVNRRALASIRYRPDDWLILAGDVGETRAHLRFAFETLGPRFRQLVWVPGNHELWTIPSIGEETRGQFRYEELIDLCRSYHVLTPEDPYPIVSLGGTEVRIAPLFLLYDYSFRPSDVPLEQAVEWAGESGVVCTDELLVHADPYPGIAQWCHARCDLTEMRLARQAGHLPTVLINHFPLRQSLAQLPSIPRFSVWCGTRRTEDWHLRFNAAVVVSGHLHIRSTQYCDGVRFEEVSLGYPDQWSKGGGTPDDYLCEIVMNATKQCEEPPQQNQSTG